MKLKNNQLVIITELKIEFWSVVFNRAILVGYSLSKVLCESTFHHCCRICCSVKYSLLLLIFGTTSSSSKSNVLLRNTVYRNTLFFVKSTIYAICACHIGFNLIVIKDRINFSIYGILGHKINYYILQKVWIESYEEWMKIYKSMIITYHSRSIKTNFIDRFSRMWGHNEFWKSSLGSYICPLLLW